MTFTTHALFGGGMFAIGFAAVSAFMPEEPFLTVHSIEMTADGIVTPIRTINHDPNIADWAVTVVGMGEGAPSCGTAPGPEEHQGWSRYAPGQIVDPMPLDEWVGDPGCWDRLTPGQYVEYTTWTPRDGTDPVTWRREFRKP